MKDQTRKLIDAARAAAAYAYAPYSGFGVGAALLLADGRVIPGANLENASYGLALCAEAAALAAANSAGDLAAVREIAVMGGTLVDGELRGTAPVRPCGRCRQMLKEASDLAGHDIVVHCAAPEGGATERYTLSTLLPYAFGPADLARD
jgi:cytidine deaminase